jgi:hypothetical protein
VGTVIGAADEETGWERIYIVLPAANPERATHVLILKNPGIASVSQAFQADSAQ